MKSILKIAVLVSAMFAAVSNTDAQERSMLDLARDVDHAAATLTDKKESFLGFKKLEMPKPLEGLLDIRFKKPTLPKFAFLEKLKNFGKPNFGTPTQGTQGPIMAGLSNLFPKRDASAPSFLDRMLGKSNGSDASSLFSAKDMSHLSSATKGLQDQVGRMSRDARTNATELFSGQNNLVPPQPPLRSARQHSGQSESRF